MELDVFEKLFTFSFSVCQLWPPGVRWPLRAARQYVPGSSGDRGRENLLFPQPLNKISELLSDCTKLYRVSTSTCQQKTVIGVCPPRPASGAGGGIDPTQRAHRYCLCCIHSVLPRPGCRVGLMGRPCLTRGQHKVMVPISWGEEGGSRQGVYLSFLSLSLGTAVCQASV